MEYITEINVFYYNHATFIREIHWVLLLNTVALFYLYHLLADINERKLHFFVGVLFCLFCLPLLSTQIPWVDLPALVCMLLVYSVTCYKLINLTKIG